MHTTIDLKSCVENFDNLYEFVYKKDLQILYCKLSHRLNSQRIKLEFEGFYLSFM